MISMRAATTTAVLWLVTVTTAWGQQPDAAHQHATPPEAAAPQASVDTPSTVGVSADVVPVLTDADRAAAFPPVDRHALSDNRVNYFVLFDQLEATTHGRGGALGWDVRGWVGKDRDRLWFRSEGLGARGGREPVQAHVLYGRAIARWWDVVLGARQDVGGGASGTWAAVGLQGLAPYWFDVELTGYVGGGRPWFRAETEYELLLTNRLTLQPLIEVEVQGGSQPERRLGAGLSELEAGLRLRYQIRRELAPYVGLTWDRRFFGTAAFARQAGEPSSKARLVVGLRSWL